jgi:hypothetical protein
MMSFFTMLFDLFTAIPLLCLLALIFCIVQYRKKNQHEKVYWRWCVGLGLVNVWFLGAHYNALFGSGPLRGVVVDVNTGKPIEGVIVRATWNSGGMPPAGPAWIFFLNRISRLKCSVGSEQMVTDSSGRFSSNQWYGAKVWHGCGRGTYFTSARGYQFIHRDARDERRFHKVTLFEEARIELTPETLQGAGKGY